MKTKFQAGDLSRVVHFLRPKRTKNNHSGEMEWTETGCIKAWAYKEDTINRQIKEDMVAEQIVASGQTVFVTRWTATTEVLEDWLAADKFSGTRYTIEGITELNKQWRVFHCMRKDNL